jgi:hypothetical protein
MYKDGRKTEANEPTLKVYFKTRLLKTLLIVRFMEILLIVLLVDYPLI